MKILNIMFAKIPQLLVAFYVLLQEVPQLWAILTLQAMQQALAVSTGTMVQDNSWNFGQIVAVVILALFFSSPFTRTSEARRNSTTRRMDTILVVILKAKTSLRMA